MGGLAFAPALPKAGTLEDGDALRLEDGRLVLVKAAAEPLLEVRAENPARLMRLAWQLGGNHVQAEVGADVLYIPASPANAELVRGGGCVATPVSRAFSPEKAAHDHSTCGHDHSHDHAHHDHAHHDHDHQHEHSHIMPTAMTMTMITVIRMATRIAMTTIIRTITGTSITGMSTEGPHRRRIALSAGLIGLVLAFPAAAGPDPTRDVLWMALKTCVLAKKVANRTFPCLSVDLGGEDRPGTAVCGHRESGRISS